MTSQPNMTASRYRLFRWFAFWIGFAAYVVSTQLDDPANAGLFRYAFLACMGAGVISFPVEVLVRRRAPPT